MAMCGVVRVVIPKNCDARAVIVTSSVLLCAIWNFFKTHAFPHARTEASIGAAQVYCLFFSFTNTMLRKFHEQSP